jgi:hypothetical protein
MLIVSYINLGFAKTGPYCAYLQPIDEQSMLSLKVFQERAKVTPKND